MCPWCSINEQAHKLPYYAALLLVLSKDEFQLDPAPDRQPQDPITDRVKSRANALASNDDPFTSGPSGGEAEAEVEAALGGDGGRDKMNVDTHNEAEAGEGSNGADVEEERDRKRKERCMSWLILRDLGIRFREWVDQRSWLKVRLAVSLETQFGSQIHTSSWSSLSLWCQVSFFGHLVPIGLVSAESYLATLRSFISVLKELGGGGKRAEKVIRVVTEGLLRVSHGLENVLRQIPEKADFKPIYNRLDLDFTKPINKLLTK
jgi:hypothetical protein